MLRVQLDYHLAVLTILQELCLLHNLLRYIVGSAGMLSLLRFIYCPNIVSSLRIAQYLLEACHVILPAPAKAVFLSDFLTRNYHIKGCLPRHLHALLLPLAIGHATLLILILLLCKTAAISFALHNLHLTYQVI